MSAEMADWLKSEESREYFELLRYPSVGAHPQRLKESSQCATWLKKWLQKIGADAKCILPEAGDAASFAPPVVFGELKGREDAPVVLVYGHYDVQPADPLELWTSDPFEPCVKGDRVYARGAQDDKGQLFALLCGIREALKENPGSLPTLKFVFEGQEESGSAALQSLVPSMRRDLAADILLVCDTSAAEGLKPAIVAGLRGMNTFTLKLTAANRDLHSGQYGGVAPNVAQGIAELVASLHRADGSIAVDGFLAGIEPPSAEELALAEKSAPKAEDWRSDIGCEPAGGERAKSIVSRNSFEPTIEINGIHSGYGGSGAKTVIPSEAIAKVSTRLVPGQNPRLSFEAIKKHLFDRVPEGMKLEICDFAGAAAGFRLPVASPLFRLAEDVLSEMDDRGVSFLWEGASIPVVSALCAESGASPLLVGWGQNEDRIHSPNESFSLAQFMKAKEWGKRIVSAF
jgi:acetylornithine deacetylase/succinyl-diaminopimelate desuccinylase-like protein